MLLGRCFGDRAQNVSLVRVRHFADEKHGLFRDGKMLMGFTRIRLNFEGLIAQKPTNNAFYQFHPHRHQTR